MKKKIKFISPNIFVSQNIAIIGNSSSILKKKNGSKIDSYDDVIRFNNSKTRTFEDNVGKKTTIRVINNVTFECIKPGLGWEDSKNDYNFVLSLNNIKIVTISPYTIRKDIKNKNMKNNNDYFFLEKRYIQFLICLNKK